MRDACICATWFMQLCEITRAHAWFYLWERDVANAWCTCVAGLTYAWEMTRACVCCDLYERGVPVRVARLVYVIEITCACELSKCVRTPCGGTGCIYVCGVTHESWVGKIARADVWLDWCGECVMYISCICAAGLIHVCEITRANVWFKLWELNVANAW